MLKTDTDAENNYSNATEAISRRIEKQYGPAWRSTRSIAGMIVSLSTGALALAAAFPEKYMWSSSWWAIFMLVATMVCLVISIISGVISVYNIHKTTFIPIELWQRQDIVAQKLQVALDSDDPTRNAADVLVPELMIVKTLNNRALFLQRLSLRAFVIAILMVGAMGITSIVRPSSRPSSTSTPTPLCCVKIVDPA